MYKRRFFSLFGTEDNDMSVGGFTPVMPSAAHDAKVHERAVDSNQRTAQAGEKKESEASSSDRDADGRQAWQWNQRQRQQQSEPEHKVQDISGKTGTTLDLDG
jgi:hypothetical protein